MLKLGIPDMIPEFFFFGYSPSNARLYRSQEERKSNNSLCEPLELRFRGEYKNFMLGVGMFDTTTVFLFGFF